MSESVDNYLAHLGIEVSPELKHHGVKGMKWGVRRSDEELDRLNSARSAAASGDKKAAKALSKADSKWEKDLNSMNGFIKVNNAIADKMNGDDGLIAKHNSNPKWKDKDLTDPKNSKIADEYYSAFDKLSAKTYESVVKELYGESPSGKYEASVDRGSGSIVVRPKSEELKHGYENGVFTFPLVVDDNGFILSVSTNGELKHFGVKGMKWGVRKDKPSSGRGSGGWTADQKQKARNVAKVAGTVAVGAALVAATVYAGKGGAYGGFSQKAKAGQNIAESVLKAKGSTKISLDPDLAKFIKDAPARILSDQKGWSESLGKSLNRIQAEDAAYMAEYIRTYAPKALGA